MFNTLMDLIGLRIDDNSIKEFMENNGFKYPSKPIISNKASDTSYWIQNRKLGIDLLFSAITYLDNYPLIPGDRKGSFIPILSNVRWYGNKSKTVFPLGLEFNHHLDTLKEKLSEPKMGDYDIPAAFLSNGGGEILDSWSSRLDSRDIGWGIELNGDQTICEFSLGLGGGSYIFLLYDQWMYQTFESFLTAQNFDRTIDLIFLQWAIEKDLISGGKLPVVEWVHTLNRGYVTDRDFSAEYEFINAYINNLSGYDILYRKDIAYAFLKTRTLKNNYLGEDAMAILNKVVYNEENYVIVKAIIDRRFEEYKKHQFSKSK